jgi:hypothetical protein
MTVPFLQLALPGVLLYAGIAKTLATDAFRSTLVASGIPETFATGLMRSVRGLEVGLALLLVMGSTTVLAVSFALTAALFGVFTGWVLLVLGRGLQISCACFGRERRKVNFLTLARNLLLLTAAIAGALGALRTETFLIQDLSLSTVIAGTSAMATAALGAAVWLVKNDLVLSRNDPRVLAAEEG